MSGSATSNWLLDTITVYGVGGAASSNFVVTGHVTGHCTVPEDRPQPKGTAKQFGMSLQRKRWKR